MTLDAAGLRTLGSDFGVKVVIVSCQFVFPLQFRLTELEVAQQNGPAEGVRVEKVRDRLQG